MNAADNGGVTIDIHKGWVSATFGDYQRAWQATPTYIDGQPVEPRTFKLDDRAEILAFIMRVLDVGPPEELYYPDEWAYVQYKAHQAESA